MTDDPSHPAHRPQLAQMTWPEVADAHEHAPLVIVPTGACEQHGRHMALATDTVRGSAVADLIAERLSPRAVVTPCLPIGVSGHHMAFPGTLSLQAVTFQQILIDVVQSLYAHGWRKVFVLNGHGGNNSATGVAASQLQGLLPDLQVAWSGITPVAKDLAQELASGPGAAHSSEIETSQALYVDPSLVRAELLDGEAATPTMHPRPRVPSGAHLALPFDQISDIGSTGRPAAATREIGEKLITAVVDRLSTFLTEFIHTPTHAETTR